MDQYRRLRLSRRLDWRFLLPDPNLGVVGYLGTEDVELLGALEAFGQGVACLNGGKPTPPFSLLVLKDLRWPQICEASRLLPPGGWFYAELPTKTVLRRYPLHPKVLFGSAFAFAHWHWPSFSEAEELVPLETPQGLYTMLQRRARYARSAELRLARLAVRSKFIPSLRPHVSWLGQRPG